MAKQQNTYEPSAQERAMDGANKGSVGGPYGAIFGALDGYLNGPLYKTTVPKNKAMNGQNGLPDFTGVKQPKVKVFDVARRASNFNATEGLANAGRIASASNARAVTDLEAAMSRLFGGGAEFNHQRELTDSMIEDHLNGKVSQSTRQELGRNMLDSGVTSLGEGPSDDLYAGYLGLTKEGLQTQGGNEYRSMYSMYRQALPLTTAAQNMEFTTIKPADMVQLSQVEAMNRFNAAIALRGAQYNVGYNGMVMQQGARNSEMAANNQMMAGFAQVAGTMYGEYRQSQKSNGGSGSFVGYSNSPTGYANGGGSSGSNGGYNAFTGSGSSSGAQVSEGI